LEKVLYSVSDPRSPFYGKHLSIDDLTKIIAPPVRDLELVLSWLESNGVFGATYPPNRDFVIVDTTVAHAEALLDCNIVYFEQRFTHKRIMRAGTSYFIPDELSHIVDFVAGLRGFPYGSWTPIRSAVGAGGSTPETLWKLYQVTVPTASCGCNTSQAVVEFSGANYSPTDLQTFFTKYAPQFEGQVIPTQNVYGTNNPSGHISVEANLDVQYIMSLGGFVPTSDYIQPPNPDILDAFYDYTQVVASQANAPLVHSISWGEYGGQYDNTTVQRINTEFMKMGARGISISLASGDNGVGCGDFCSAQEFDFPSSPYVTMVGATQLLPKGGEGGATLSAGGFSRDYYQPSYQTAAVTSYLNSGVQLPTDSYDATGRAYPDVSALGMGIEVVVNGRSEPVDGTSCSAPIFGGIISLLNAQRALAGKPPLGWLNPWIYQNPQMFTDITTGENSYECCQGFKAATGWDPVTGWGSPLYPAMLTAALAA